MILGESGRLIGNTSTLDDLFRRAGVRHPDALALADPPNRQTFTDGAPHKLSFAQADRAISAVAARLRALGLQTDAVVAIQLPCTVESIITFLGVLRAGMIAAPIPLLWRRQEMVAALGQIGTKAIITSSRIGSVAHAEIAMHTAADLFPIRQVCGFGHALPDGVVPLDDVFDSGGDFEAAPPRPGPAAAHVAAVTFGHDAKGAIPIARNHSELITGGRVVSLEADIAAEATILSTIPIGSFAGIALTIVPWLLSGGTLHLHHGFDPIAFAAQSSTSPDGIIVVPGQVLSPLLEAGVLADENQSIVALWRAPDRLAATSPWTGAKPLIDVASFGEIGLVATHRAADGSPPPLRRGVIAAPRDAVGAMTAIETARSNAGTLALRGTMVPAHAFPPGAERDQTRHLTLDPAGYVDTGFGCQLDNDSQTFAVTTPPAGLVAIGGYSFRQSDVDAAVAQIDPNATIVALPDGNLGQRFAGNAADRDVLRRKLQAQGVNPLISGAFHLRATPEAA